MTVDELKQRMSQREFMDWFAYVEEYGELSPARMYDRGSAQVTWMLQGLKGGRNTLADYLPFHRDTTQELSGSDLESGLLAQFSALSKV